LRTSEVFRTEGAHALDEALPLEGVSVLMVDDQEEARVVLTQALSEYGAHVTALSSGVEALALLSHPPGGRRPDVLILDIAMPGEDGYTVLKKLRALQAGFRMHVAKPVEPAELAVIIGSLTNRRVWERGPKKCYDFFG
jgi:CheY-like chemotaxis protein